jgi:hypothetical protein
MTVARVQVRDCIQRLVGVWPTLRKRDTMRDEIGRAVMAHADRLMPGDLDAGVDMLIRTARAQQDDGGPASPPGPGEVLGCILAARRDRLAGTTPSAADRDTSAKDTGRTCRRSGCGDILMWLPSEGAYYCDKCRTVTYA